MCSLLEHMERAQCELAGQVQLDCRDVGKFEESAGRAYTLLFACRNKRWSLSCLAPPSPTSSGSMSRGMAVRRGCCITSLLSPHASGKAPFLRPTD